MEKRFDLGDRWGRLITLRSPEWGLSLENQADFHDCGALGGEALGGGAWGMQVKIRKRRLFLGGPEFLRSGSLRHN